VVLGRNSECGGEDLRKALADSPVKVRIAGLVSAEEVVRELGQSDVMLFARGPISSRRGSAIAGIACGLPVIAEKGWELASPITEAGVVLVPEGQLATGFGAALARVLVDLPYRTSLAERSRNAQSQYFSWRVIAGKYVQTFRKLNHLSARSSVHSRAFFRGFCATFTVTAFGRSRPAADATREVVERWLLDGLM
jgi:glycosyltransferase involved in cell wall biosynthesis